MATRITRRTVHVTFKRGDIWLLTTGRHDLADGLTIRLRERRGSRARTAAFSLSGDFLIERLESFPFDIAAGLVGAWLYDVLKGNRATVRMDGKGSATTAVGIGVDLAVQGVIVQAGFREPHLHGPAGRHLHHEKDLRPSAGAS